MRLAIRVIITSLVLWPPFQIWGQGGEILLTPRHQIDLPDPSLTEDSTTHVPDSGLESAAPFDESPPDLFLEHDRGAEPIFRLRGRIDADAIWVSQSPVNEATFGDIEDVASLRRARIGAEGNLTSDTRYVAEIDLASGKVVVRDLFAGLGRMEGTGQFRFGHFREPFSLEGGTSANTFAFLERSPVNNLDPARNWGAGFFRCSPGEDSTLAIGIFKSGTDSSDFQGGDGSDTAVTARWTMLPRYECDGEQMSHVGLALSARLPDNGVVVIEQGPTSPLVQLDDSSASPFVPSVRVPANFQQLLNAQWAYVNGSLWAQAEWYGSLIDQERGQPVFLHGSYVDIGYFLTGDRRSYRTQDGVFGPVTVQRPLLRGMSSRHHAQPLGGGAWELTGRFSYLDFSDSDLPLDPQGLLVGVNLPQFTAGVNWYLTDHMRIMFNYYCSIPDEPNTGSSTSRVFATRFAVFW